nr:imidazole glycerol phosphate synthase subunit HisH [Pedobacter panaciterrae]
MIAVIDYGIGNIGSVLNMFKKIGVKDVCFTGKEEDIKAADKILLPGVGSFDRGMDSLKRSGLIPVLKDFALVDKKPILGICLGMQLLTSRSDEGQSNGLGFINGETLAFSFPKESNLKIPHMGWNEVMVEKENTLIPYGTSSRFYFVHSYYVKCHNDADILATANYGINFTCAFQCDNIFGTQFHPEKSHKFGMQVLKNFSLI